MLVRGGHDQGGLLGGFGRGMFRAPLPGPRRREDRRHCGPRTGDALVVWTVADSGKVKRIRRSGEVTVAPCDFRGRPRGEAVAGHARLTGSVAEDRRIRGMIARKYGIVGRLSLLGSRLRRGRVGTVGLHITLTA